MHLEAFVRAGMLPIITLGQPGIQGAAVAGIQGIGVNTPRAAAVAAATIGLEGLMHIANGTMFMNGFESIILAAGITPPKTLLIGGTISVEGAAPNEQAKPAPIVTNVGIMRAIIAIVMTFGQQCNEAELA